MKCKTITNATQTGGQKRKSDPPAAIVGTVRAPGKNSWKACSIASYSGPSAGERVAVPGDEVLNLYLVGEVAEGVTQ